MLPGVHRAQISPASFEQRNHCCVGPRKLANHVLVLRAFTPNVVLSADLLAKLEKLARQPRPSIISNSKVDANPFFQE